MTTPHRYQNTDLAPWSPAFDFDRMASPLGRFFDGRRDPPSMSSDGFVPRAGVEEADGEYVVDLEARGVNKQDIDVSLDDRRLTISAERKEREGAGALGRTRSAGRFRFDVVLPGDIDRDNVSASLDDGVLTVRLPRKAEQRQRRIKVS
jgi:HSP20 family protein